MADGITIRNRFEAILFKLELTEDVDASPTGAADAIPFEAGSFTNGSATRVIESTEASGSLGQGAPLIVGQTVPISFRFAVKGAGAGVTYSGSVKPPHDAVYAAAGWRGVFTAAVSTAVLTAGSTTTGTLGTGFGTTAQMYRGMPFAVTAGPNTGETLLCTDYTAGKLATFADLLPTALTTSSSLALLANWSYANTSPASSAARLTDHPSGTLYRYLDGKLRRFTGVRGQINVAANSSGALIATFTGTATYRGETDAAIPAQPNLASHSAPIMLQGANASEAFLINRRPLPISNFSFETQATVEAPDDPNSANGFMPATIGARRPRLTCDPLATLVATRDIKADISNLAIYTGLCRFGYTSGNRAALTWPRLQPVASDDVDRGQFSAEAVQLMALMPPTQDSNTRDNDYVLSFS
jgi:hypothetical protein